MSVRHPNTLHRVTPFALVAAACAFLGASACGESDDGADEAMSQRPLQCDSATYVSFDRANHVNQELRVRAYEDMLALMKAAEADPAQAAAKFAEAERLYEDTADLSARVEGRTEDHLAGSPNIGMELDATIQAGLEAGKRATTALEANLAKQKVDKTLIHFFFVSVYHEILEGKRSKWDEAFGYFGAPSDNDEGRRKGLAKVATKRDAENGTTFASAIFNGIVDGSCELELALRATGGEEVDRAGHPAFAKIVEKIDLDMQKVLAHSAAHEAFEMNEIQAELAINATQDLRDEMRVKLAELEPYFHAVEPLMTLRGGESSARGARIRAAIDAAKRDLGDGWMQSMDAAGIVSDLESEYQIDVRG